MWCGVLLFFLELGANINEDKRGFIFIDTKKRQKVSYSVFTFCALDSYTCHKKKVELKIALLTIL